MSFTTRLAAPMLAVLIGSAAVGCGGGYDEDEAAAACDALVGSVDTSGAESYDECIACHVECGEECAVLESFPPQFACPD